MGLAGVQENVKKILKLIKGHCKECNHYAKHLERIRN